MSTSSRKHSKRPEARAPPSREDAPGCSHLVTAGGVEEAAPTKRSTLGFTMSSLAGFVVIRMAVLADSVAALAVAVEPTELSKEATKEQAFLRWLEREGADVSKVVWPVRGARRRRAGGAGGGGGAPGAGGLV